MTTEKPNQCNCDFENAKLISRAKWVCPNCGRDFSIEYMFWAEAAHPEWLEDLPYNKMITSVANL